MFKVSDLITDLIVAAVLGSVIIWAADINVKFEQFVILLLALAFVLSKSINDNMLIMAICHIVTFVVFFVVLNLISLKLFEMIVTYQLIFLAVVFCKIQLEKNNVLNNL